jgi:hypothetical protein
VRYSSKPRRDPGPVYAARYEATGRPLGELLAVARMKDSGAVLGECAELGVLVVRYLDVPDDHPATLHYEVVPEGHYLVYSDDYHLLYTDDARSFAREHVLPEGST